MDICIKNKLKKGVKVIEKRKLPSGRIAYLEWIVISRDKKNNKVTIKSPFDNVKVINYTETTKD